MHQQRLIQKIKHHITLERHHIFTFDPTGELVRKRDEYVDAAEAFVSVHAEHCLTIATAGGQTFAGEKAKKEGREYKQALIGMEVACMRFCGQVRKAGEDMDREEKEVACACRTLSAMLQFDDNGSVDEGKRRAADMGTLRRHTGAESMHLLIVC